VSARAETRPPTDPTSGRWRLARVVGLGIAAYGLAVGAHVSAGGGWPGWPVSVMLAALLGVLGVAFTTRRRRLPAVFGVLTAAQAALHVLLSLLDVPASSCSAVAVGHHAATSCDPSVPTTGSVAMAMPSLPMLVAHVAATAATAWVLARGEAWLWRTLRGILAAPVPAPITAAPRVWVLHREAVRPTIRWARPDAPRGPPEPAVFAI
jgi:MYXO-CTERM domain-containing protein